MLQYVGSHFFHLVIHYQDLPIFCVTLNTVKDWFLSSCANTLNNAHHIVGAQQISVE